MPNNVISQSNPSAIEKSISKKKSKRGGKRPGAGRKPKLEWEARRLFNKFVDKHWKEIENGLLFWIKKKDKYVLEKILEQRIGRAGQSIHMGNEDPSNPFLIKIVEYARNNPPV